MLVLSGDDARASHSGFVSLNAAKIAFVDRDYETAEKYARQIAGLEAKAFLGRILLERGRLTEARECFNAVLKEVPKNYESTRGIAVVYEGMGQAELAVVYYRRAAELRKDDPGAWRELAAAQRRNGDNMGAMSAMQQALALDPKGADLSNVMTNLHTGRSPMGRRFDPMNPKPIDPRSLVPRPKVPDPKRWMPNRRRQK